MKAATVKNLKQELSEKKPQELLELCLRLAKFKKENKELLTYLLFEASDEKSYVENIKKEIKSEFQQINTSSYFFIKKSVRKILRACVKYIRYSKKKDTEVDIRLFFCHELIRMTPTLKRSSILQNMYHRQIKTIRKVVGSLHEDLQYDYQLELEELEAMYLKR